ncbi:MAG: type II toxin-antitoxin system prevent-host-death family antitoxin [Acidobacteria bacterium]|nr:type II toxin-antitoxin system prevent-host-death family antitoxin [Acidobacteriota bacterium]
MSLVYSTYEAKARFSEIIREVRAGNVVTVSYRGEPVAEIRAIRREPQTLEARLDGLERRGIVAPSGQRKAARTALARRPGALKRFLDERNE